MSEHGTLVVDCNGILPSDPPKSNLLSRPRHAAPGGHVVPRPATRRTSSGPRRPQNRLRTIEIRWVLAKDYGPRGLSGKIESESPNLEAFGRTMNSRMQRANPFKEMAIHDVLNGAERIPAKNIYIIPLNNLIPALFELDRCFSVTECP